MSPGVGLVVGAMGGGGVVLVTPGWDRGEENQRMGDGRRKAFPGPDPFSIVPPLGEPLFTSSITASKNGSTGAPPLPSQPAVIYSEQFFQADWRHEGGGGGCFSASGRKVPSQLRFV